MERGGKTIWVAIIGAAGAVLAALVAGVATIVHINSAGSKAVTPAAAIRLTVADTIGSNIFHQTKEEVTLTINGQDTFLGVNNGDEPTAAVTIMLPAGGQYAYSTSVDADFFVAGESFHLGAACQDTIQVPPDGARFELDAVYADGTQQCQPPQKGQVWRLKLVPIDSGIAGSAAHTP